MKISNLSKSYNKELFKDINLEINSGILEINGVSGSGKSTFLNILMNKVKADKGTFFIKDNYIYSYYGREETLFKKESIEKNFELFFLKKIDDQFISLLKTFNLEKNLTKPLIDYSGGEYQKISMCFCLYKKADIYLLDEPFNNIDEDSIKKIYNLLNEFSKDHLIVLSSHKEEKDNLNLTAEIYLKNPIEVKVFKDSKELDKTSTNLNISNKFFIHTFIYLLKNNKLYFSFKFLMLFLIVLSFSFLCITYKNYDRYNSYKARLNASIFSNFNTTIKINENVNYDDFIQKIPSRKYVVKYVDNESTTYFIDSLKDDKLLYFTNSENYVFLSDNTKLTVNENENYDVLKLEDKSLLNNININSEEISSIIDGYNKKDCIVLTSPYIINNLLSNNSTYQKTKFTSLFGFNDSLTKASFASKKANIKVIDGEKIFKSPNLKAGDTFTLVNKDNYINFNVTENSNDTYYYLSKDIYLFLVTLYKTSFDETKGFGNTFICDLLLEKQDILHNINNVISVSNLLFDFSAKINKYQYLSLILICTLIAIYIIFAILFMPYIRKKYKEIENLYINNGINITKLQKAFLLSYLSIYVITFIVSLISYYLTIYLANYLLMVNYPSHKVGPSFYSKQPTNPYYDNIKSPMNLVTFSSFYFYIFSIVFFFLLLDLLIILKTKKKKK